MVRLNFVACSLILTSFFGIGSCQSFGFLRQDNAYRKKLREYVTKHHLSHAQKYDIQLFDQKLDHFNPADTETWKQAYAEKMTDYKNNGVVFLMIEGETIINPFVLDYSAMGSFGKKYGAAMFVLEHRFYGYSQPKPDWSVDSLKYLSSEQALADFAYFITKMNEEHEFSNPKWIVFGGSYAGNLAAWLRYKYPHLVYAAISSSAPIEAKLDFSEFLETVADALATVNPDCVDVIRAANQEMSKGVTDVIKIEEYRETFRLCKPLEDNVDDISSFFMSLVNPFVMAAMTADFASMDRMCKKLTDRQIKCPVERYARVFKPEWSGGSCHNHCYEDGIKFLRDTSIYRYLILRPWYYQTCTEFGFYQTSNKKDSAFGDKLSLKMITDTCTDVYENSFNMSFVNRSIEETNMNYGALSLEVERVVFVHGSLDPWSPLGIRSNPPPGSYAIVINGTSHCGDMGPESKDDMPQLAKAKSKLSELIGDWLSNKQHWTRKRSAFHF